MSSKALSKTADAYPEVQDIQDDISALKNHSVKLAQHVTENGKEQIQVMAKSAQEQAMSLKKSGAEQLKKMEKQVQAKPVQALAIAFGVGVIASLILGRR